MKQFVVSSQQSFTDLQGSSGQASESKHMAQTHYYHNLTSFPVENKYPTWLETQRRNWSGIQPVLRDQTCEDKPSPHL